MVFASIKQCHENKSYRLILFYLQMIFYFTVFDAPKYFSQDWYTYPADNHLLKVKKRYTRTRCEICSKLTIKTPERRQWRRSGIFIVNFEHISHLVLVFLFLTLNM